MRLNPPAIDLPLQSRLTARALLNRFMLAALFCCAGSLWASAQDFSATATNVAPSNIYDGQRRQVLRVAITNLAGGTSADLRLKTLGLRFENAAGNPLNTADAGNLFESVEVYRDTDSSGTFNALNDGLLTGLYYPELDANGSLSVDLQDSDPADREVLSGASQSYFVVVKLNPNASAAVPHEFRIIHLANGPSATTAEDASPAVQLTLSPTANVPSGLVTAAFNQPPTATPISDVVVYDPATTSTVPLFAAFQDAEDSSAQLTYAVTANSNPGLFQVIGFDPVTGNLSLSYASGTNGIAQITVQATDTLGKSVSSTFTVKVTPLATLNDYLLLRFPGDSLPGPLASSLGNGQSNLLSYAFYLNQGINGGVAGLPRVFANRNARIFSHLRPKFSGDLNYHYEISPDLATWSPAVKNIHYFEHTTDLGDGSLRVELLMLSTNAKSFMRAKVDLTTPPSPPPAAVPPPPGGGSSTPPVATTNPPPPTLPPPPTGLGQPIHSSALFPIQTILSTTQRYATSIVSADFNQDGFVDIVACSSLDDSVAWYPNNGNGTFGAKQLITNAARNASCVRAADLDGDGLIDVISASESDNKIAWYKGLPGGGFGPQVVISTINGVPIGNFATCVAVADLDGDGKPDVLGAYAIDSKIVWCKNLGNGSFAAPQVITTESSVVWCIATADLDGDGFQDIIATSLGDHTIGWYHGNGDGTFGTRQVITSNALNSVSAAVADIDGDGIPDVVAAYAAGNKVVWFRNTGGGVFGPPQLISTAVSGPYSVRPVDVDGDGLIDVVSASLSDNKIAWYRNLGGGNFGDPTTNQIIISTSTIGAIDVTAGDFDHNGLMDVASASQNDSKIAVYLNRGGQSAFLTSDTAPTAITEGLRHDVLKVAVSNRGVPGDDNARLASMALLLESAPGVPLTTAQANSLIENLYIYSDSNNSGTFEPGVDAPIAIVPYLSLNAGRLVVSIRSNSPDALIAPNTTRNFFVVPELTLTASTQVLSGFQITHITQGTMHSIVKDAASGAVLTLEGSAQGVMTSSPVSAQANQPPGTIGIPNVAVLDTDVPTIVPITNYFNDAEDGATGLRYAVTQNTNPNLFAFAGIEAATGKLKLQYKPGKSGSASITVQAADSLGKTVSSSFLVTVNLADTFAHWAALNGGPPNSGPIDNILKYAYALNGGVVAGLPRVQINGKARVFRHLKPRWATDLAYHYEVSQDMVTWTPAVNGIHYQEFDTNLPNAIQQADLVLLVDWPRAFMRARTVLSN